MEDTEQRGPGIENGSELSNIMERSILIGLVQPRKVVHLGRNPFNQNFRKCRSKSEWIGSVQPGKFRKNWPTFRGGPLFSVGPVRSIIYPFHLTIPNLSQSQYLAVRYFLFNMEESVETSNLAGTSTSNAPSLLVQPLQMVDNGFIPAACSPVRSFNTYVFLSYKLSVCFDCFRAHVKTCHFHFLI